MIKNMNSKLEADIKEYYKQKFARKKFIPGKTYVPVSGKIFDQKEMIAMTEAVLDGWWTEGRFSNEFERKLSQKIGVKFCIPVNSGSSANLLAISALTSYKLGEKRLKAGDEIITLAAGFPTTIGPIIINNLIPVFVDLDLQTYNINAERLEEAISEKTKAIFIAHTLGNPFNIKKVLEICKKHNLWLIEDNCDALGSRYKNKYTGSFGHIATQSFYPAHHITSGEGGVLLTKDFLLAKIIRSLKDWGRDCWCPTGNDNTCAKRFSQKHGDLPIGYDHKYVYSEIGYNLKWTDMQAALALTQLGKLDKFILKRRENFDYLLKNLKKFNKYFSFFRPEKGSKPSWFGFLITLKENCPFSREEICKYLNDNKIGTRLLFAGNIIKQPVFTNQKIKFRIFGNLDNSDYVMKNTFWVGCYHGLDKEKLDYMVGKFEKFIEIYGK